MRTLLSGALFSVWLLSPIPRIASAAAAVTPSLRWSTYFGGTGFELGTCVALDTAGNVYFGGTVGEQAWEIAVNPTGTTIVMVGGTTSPDFPTLNGYQSTLTGATAAFVTVFDAAATGPGGGTGPGAGGGCGLIGLEEVLLALIRRRALRLR